MRIGVRLCLKAAVSCPSGGGHGTGQADGGGSRLSRGDRSDVAGGHCSPWSAGQGYVASVTELLAAGYD